MSYRQVSPIALQTLLVMLVLPTTIAFAIEDPTFDPGNPNFEQPAYQYAEQVPTAAERRRSKKRFPGYYKQKKKFERWCKYIAEDARNGWLYEELKLHLDDNPSCKACKPLFKMVSSSCRPRDTAKKKRGKKEAKNAQESAEQADKTKPPEEEFQQRKQLEPRLTALDQASRVFFSLASNERLLPENYTAVMELLKILRDPNNKTRGEQQYFAILAEYVYAPFRQHDILVNTEKRVKKERNRMFNTERFGVESLFDE